MPKAVILPPGLEDEDYENNYGLLTSYFNGPWPEDWVAVAQDGCVLAYFADEIDAEKFIKLLNAE